MDIASLVAKARQQFEEAKPAEQGILLGGEVVVARIWPLEGADWRALKAKHPPRIKDGEMLASDAAYGFNLDGVVASYPRLVLIQDGAEVPIEAEQWAEVCTVLSGPDLDALAMLVWGKNEYEPQQRLLAAGKALSGERAKKPASPENSASPSES